MADKAGIIFSIKADSKDAQAKINAFKGDLKELERATKDQLGPLENLAARAGLNATQFNNLKIGALAAVAGIGAIVGAAAAAGAGLFALAKKASDYGSEIFDAMEKTGLGAQTLSSLKVAAEQSGSSFEAISGSISKFSVLIGEAKNGSDKAIATLQRYGITSRNTQGALEQAILTIAKMTDTDKQAAAAKELFKDRTGAILPVIKSFDGDLPGLIAKLKQLGVVMTDEDAKAADEFGDTLDTLSQQAAATGRVFIGPLMRDITSAMGDISSSLSKNQNAVKEWGDSIATTLRGLKNIAKEIYDYAQTPQGRILKNVFFADVMLANRAIQSFAGPPPPQGTPLPHMLDGSEKVLPKNANNIGYGLTEEQKKAAEDRRKAREVAFQQEIAALSKKNSLILAAERSTYAAAQNILEQYYLEKKNLVDKDGNETVLTAAKYQELALKDIVLYGQRVQALLDQQRDLGLKGKTGTARDNVLLEYQNASSALYRELQQERADLEKTITGVVKKESEERKKLTEEQARDAIAIAKATAQTQIETIEASSQAESDKAVLIGNIRLALLAKEIELETVENRRLVLNEEYAQQVIRNSNLIIEALKREGIEYAKRLEAEKGPLDGLGKVGIPRPEVAGGDGSTDPRSNFEKLIENFEGNQAAIAGIEALQTAFEGLGQAIGQVVQAWILYGNAGTNVRKVTAQILAGIAQQAAVKAIFELAEGFAALARAFFGDPKAGAEAAMHFKAAAIYGTVAGVAAVAGRAVAGNEFNKQSSTATGGGSGQGGEGESQRNELTTRFRGFRDEEGKGLFRVLDAIVDEMKTSRRVNGQLEQTTHDLRTHIRGMSPGDVLTLGVQQEPDAVRRSYEGSLSDDHRSTDGLMRNSGQVR